MNEAEQGEQVGEVRMVSGSSMTNVSRLTASLDEMKQLRCVELDVGWLVAGWLTAARCCC